MGPAIEQVANRKTQIRLPEEGAAASRVWLLQTSWHKSRYMLMPMRLRPAIDRLFCRYRQFLAKRPLKG
jgi:hypothetical protein